MNWSSLNIHSVKDLPLKKVVLQREDHVFEAYLYLHFIVINYTSPPWQQPDCISWNTARPRSRVSSNAKLKPALPENFRTLAGIYNMNTEAQQVATTLAIYGIAHLLRG